jgi:hypothetical protein
MTTERLHWRIVPAASWLHAADAVRRGLPLIDPKVRTALREPVDRLDQSLAAAGCDAARFWEAAIARSLHVQSIRRWVEESLQAALGKSGDARTIQRLADCAAELERAALALWPHLAEDLRLRERPLREQWESRGPGLLRRARRVAGADLTKLEADVALVEPCLGGGGEVHSEFRLVRLEAVLANPQSALPEPVRLAWLLFRLAAECTDGALAKSPSPQRRLIALAAVPLVLEAAEYVEWSRCDPATLQLALDSWLQSADKPQLAEVLLEWRNTTRRAAWPEALAALAAELE